MSDHIGAVRIDEFIFPIDSLKFVRGGIEVKAHANGPMNEVSGFVRLFTHEGEPVLDGARGQTSRVDLPRLEPGEVCEFVYVLIIAEMGRTEEVSRRG